ncbi:hypothetical protein [Brevibacterium yomogidense]|uniref:hypothetical protein n=1 Tax=Brevibacterium yomogidense TaxID=946573 RepID=UPI0018DEF7C9|nr:hypothetical protein [Brevibacterium yomogidense]
MEHDENHGGGPRSVPPGSAADGAVLRTSSAVTIGWVTIAAAVVVAALVVLQVPPAGAVRMVGLPAFIGVVGWSCYLRPRVHLREHGVHVVNILRTYDVPFSRVTDLDLRLGVTLVTDTGRKIGVWSLPHTGRRARREGLSRGVVEPHTAAEVDRVVTAHARWQSTGHTAGSGSDRPVDHHGAAIVTRVQVVPLALCILTAVWALWGLGYISGL